MTNGLDLKVSSSHYPKWYLKYAWNEWIQFRQITFYKCQKKMQNDVHETAGGHSAGTQVEHRACPEKKVAYFTGVLAFTSLTFLF